MASIQKEWDLGWNHFQQRQFNQALSRLQPLEKKVDNETLYFVMAQCYWNIGAYKKGIKYFEKAYHRSGNAQEVLLPLVKSYLALGKKNKAQKTLDKVAINREQNQGLLFYNFLLSNALLAQAQISPIISYIQDYGVINPNFERLLLICKVFGFHQEKLKNIDNKIIQSNNQNDDFLYTLKKIHALNSQLLAFNFNTDLLNYALSQIEVEGLIIEAGVYFGISINKIAKNQKPKIIYGFDSFEGLPEAWNSKELAGAYSTQGNKPKVKKNVKLIQGWFKDTLPGFIQKHDAPVAFLHVDCDIYSSTKDVFDALQNHIVEGTVILFDDFFGFTGYENHEWKAFNEFLELKGFKAQYLAFCPLGRELAIKIHPS